MSYLPTFQTTSSMVNLVAEIVELTHAFDLNPALVPSPTVRKINQLRTVHSSTWIEGNTLTLDEVTAVIDGKRVIAPEREILEVKQAFAAYEALASMSPHSLDDLLRAHGIMMQGIKPDAGKLRDVPVGVYSGNTLIHEGTPVAELQAAMEELFAWLVASEDHPLIQGCFFHCAFEGIHPFSDGNGRTGRLWHSLINRSWKPLLAWVPMETLVAENQMGYYQVLRLSNAGEATAFIEFMLEMTRDALTEVFVHAESGTDDGTDNGTDGTENGASSANDSRQLGNRSVSDALLDALIDNPSLTVDELGAHIGRSRRQTLRLLDELKKSGSIERIGSARSGQWKVLGR